MTIILLIIIAGLCYYIYKQQPKKPRVKQTLTFKSIKIIGENLMTQFQLDQHALWSLQFLNDNGAPVEVATFEAVSNVPGLAVEILPFDPDTKTYTAKITATEVTAGSIDAKGTTASGTELPAQLAVTTIPDEAESVNSSVVIGEND